MTIWNVYWDIMLATSNLWYPYNITNSNEPYCMFASHQFLSWKQQKICITWSIFTILFYMTLLPGHNFHLRHWQLDVIRPIFNAQTHPDTTIQKKNELQTCWKYKSKPQSISWYIASVLNHEIMTLYKTPFRRLVLHISKLYVYSLNIKHIYIYPIS